MKEFPPLHSFVVDIILHFILPEFHFLTVRIFNINSRITALVQFTEELILFYMFQHKLKNTYIFRQAAHLCKWQAKEDAGQATAEISTNAPSCCFPWSHPMNSYTVKQNYKESRLNLIIHKTEASFVCSDLLMHPCVFGKTPHKTNLDAYQECCFVEFGQCPYTYL